MRKIDKSEIMGLFSVVGMSIFSSMIVMELRNEVLNQFGNPLITGVVGVLVFAYMFNIK